MKNLISGLNKFFDNRVRLGIMAMLSANDYVDFNTLKSLLEITDGNLASHLKTLEKNNLIQTNKQFIGRKPSTSYTITPLGKQLFQEHLDTLEKIIHNK